MLGPSVLGRPGRFAAGPRHWLFPPGLAQTLLHAYGTLALFLLLVVVGLEVEVGVMRRRWRAAALTGSLGILLPAACGVALGFSLPDSDLLDPSQRTAAALVLGIAVAPSVLPVIARPLLDLGLSQDGGRAPRAGCRDDRPRRWRS